MNSFQLEDYRLQQQQKYKQNQDTFQKQIKEQQEEEQKKAAIKPIISNVVGGIKVNQENPLQSQNFYYSENQQLSDLTTDKYQKQGDLEKQLYDNFDQEEIVFQQFQKEQQDKDEQLARQLQNAEEYALFQGQYEETKALNSRELQRETNQEIFQGPQEIQQPLLLQNQNRWNKRNLFLFVSLLLLITAVIIITFI